MANVICTAPNCPRKTSSGGRYCSMHYRRLKKHGSLEPGRQSPEERFWTKVDKTDACWLWIGTLARNGYGVFFHSRPDRKRVSAHRFAYEQVVGPIPEGLDIDHLCRVRRCVNPGHMEPVTRRVNTLRGIAPTAINAAKMHCARGHAFDEANTYVNHNSGQRKCRACNRERAMRRYWANRQEVDGRGEHSGAA